MSKIDTLDFYGMTPEERAQFEEVMYGIPKQPEDSYVQCCYQDDDMHQSAIAWVTCTNLYRERLEDAERQRDDARARLDELIVLHKDKLARFSETIIIRLKELEDEIAALVQR